MYISEQYEITDLAHQVTKAQVAGKPAMIVETETVDRLCRRVGLEADIEALQEQVDELESSIDSSDDLRREAENRCDELEDEKVEDQKQFTECEDIAARALQMLQDLPVQLPAKQAGELAKLEERFQAL